MRVTVRVTAEGALSLRAIGDLPGLRHACGAAGVWAGGRSVASKSEWRPRPSSHVASLGASVQAEALQAGALPAPGGLSTQRTRRPARWAGGARCARSTARRLRACRYSARRETLAWRAVRGSRLIADTTCDGVPSKLPIFRCD